jgi:hypothetical protein
MFLTPTVLGGLFSRTDLASRLPTTNPGDGKPWIDADGQLRVGVSGTSLLDSWFGSKTTTSLTEGSNLYFTTDRVTGVVTKAYVDGLGVDALTLNGQTYADIVNNTLSLGASSFAPLAHTHNSIALQDGTAASPSARFASDTDTGLFRDAANKISFAAGGDTVAELSQIGVGTWGQFHTGQLVLDPPDNVVGFWLNATAPSWEAMVVSVEGVVVLAADAAGVYTKSFESAPATPGYSFDGDRDTGLYRAGANLLGLSGGGNKRFELTANGANLYQSDGTTGGTLVLSRLQSPTDDLLVLTNEQIVYMPANSAIYPSVDFGPSLGQSTRRWKNLYTQSVLGGTSSAFYVGTSSSATHIRTASSTGIIYFDIGNLLDNAIRFNSNSFSPYDSAPQTLGESGSRWPNVFAKLANIEVPLAGTDPGLLVNRLDAASDIAKLQYDGVDRFRFYSDGTNDFFYLQGATAQITRAATALTIRDAARIDINIGGSPRAIITAGTWNQYATLAPGSDLAIDLGQSDKRWTNIHGQNIRASGATAAIQINDRIDNGNNWQFYSSNNLFFLYSNVVGNTGIRFQIDTSNFHYIRTTDANHQIVHKPSNAGHCTTQWESATTSRSVGCGFIDSGNGSWRIGTQTGGTDFFIQRGYVGSGGFALNTGGIADGIKVAADATITTVGLRAHPNNTENAYTLNVYGDGSTCVLRLNGGASNTKAINFGSGFSDRIISISSETRFYAGNVIGMWQNGTRLKVDIDIEAGKLIRQAAEITQTPAGATQTLTLADGNHQTLALTGTSGTVAVTLTAPASSAAGTIIVKQHATTPVDLTWAGSPTWLGTEPDWGADAAGKVRVVAWRYDGATMYLSATDSN